MNIFLWMGLFVVSFAAFFPMTIIKVFNINKRYYYFKYVSIILFVWTIHTWIRLLVNDPYAQYYLGLNLYPIIFFVVGMFFIAVENYLNRHISRIYFYILGIFTIIELVIVNTNALHQWMWILEPSNSLTYLDIINAKIGAFYYVHIFICYSILLYVIIHLLSDLYRNAKRDRDIFPFLFMVIGIIIGISVNIIHIFIYTFTVDPTYMIFVILILMFYFVAYIRDIKLILTMNRNEFILDNLREMYLIVNQRNEVIDASQEFIDYFNLDLDKTIFFDDLLKEIENKAIIYKDIKDLKTKFDPSRRYLHMQMKFIYIPLYKYPGKFYMFYDESEHRKYINDMNYIKSHDLMTGLYNRNYFEEIKAKIDESAQSYVLILFDLDGLKLCNDILGHEFGDNLLIEFAKRLKIVSEKWGFMPIRMGGDEFLLIAMNLNIKMIESSLKDIINILTHEVNGIKTSFSYGYAQRDSHSESLERVVSRADNNMYLMKENNIIKRDYLKKHLEEVANKINKKK